MVYVFLFNKSTYFNYRVSVTMSDVYIKMYIGAQNVLLTLALSIVGILDLR